MATTYVLIELHHQGALNPEEIGPALEAGQTIESAKLLDIDMPNGRDYLPYIAY